MNPVLSSPPIIPYMCSQTGQDMIREKIAEYALTGVVICSCSPRMHEADVPQGL